MVRAHTDSAPRAATTHTHTYSYPVCSDFPFKNRMTVKPRFLSVWAGDVVFRGWVWVGLLKLLSVAVTVLSFR